MVNLLTKNKLPKNKLHDNHEDVAAQDQVRNHVRGQVEMTTEMSLEDLAEGAFSQESTKPMGWVIAGCKLRPLENRSEEEIAWRLDRFFRDRPHLNWPPELIEKAFALAFQRIPNNLIDEDTLESPSRKEIPVAVFEKAIQEAVRRISVLAVSWRGPDKPTQT